MGLRSPFKIHNTISVMLLMTLWRLLTLLGRNLEEEEKGRATAFNVVLAFFALRYYSVVPNLFTELNIETLKGSKTFISSNVFFNPIQQVIRSRNAAIIKNTLDHKCVISGRFVYELERSFVTLTCDEGCYFMVFSFWRLIVDLYSVR